MKKIFNLSLATLAMAIVATPASAHKWAASIRGDVGPTGSQVIFEDHNSISDRKSAWDFTGRLAMYTSCSPCSTYIMGSWQGSNHRVHSRGYENFDNRISVKNEFSKAKVGFGFNTFKNHCLAVTMEFGGEFLDAKLKVEKDLTFCTGEGRAKTDGAGLYASLKGEYKFSSGCMSNWSLYGKADLADIIGRQHYHYCAPSGDTFTTDCYVPRYNNIVEVDLEAALVYSPCCKFWCNSNMNIAFGVRTDSFVNLFRYVDHACLQPDDTRATLLSLARPTLFLEFGLKM